MFRLDLTSVMKRHHCRLLSVVILAVLCVATTRPVLAQVPEIVFPDGAKTNIQFKQQKLSLEMAIIDLWKKHTLDPESTRERAKDFLERLAYQDAEMPASQCPTQCRLDDVLSRARDLRELDVIDPLLRAKITLVLNQELTPRQIQRSFNDARKTLEQSNYPEVVTFVFDLCEQKAHTRTGDRSKFKTDRQRSFESLPAYLDWASQFPDSSRVIFDTVKTQLLADDFEAKPDESRRLREVLLQQMDQRESKIPWVVSMIRGEIDKDEGWQIRGTSYAYKLTEEQVEGFSLRLAKAAKHFRLAWELAPQRPEAAAAMAWLIRSGHDDQDSIWDWLQRSNDAEIDHLDTWAAVMSYLEPKWFGTNEQRRNLAVQCARSNRFDTDLPLVFCQWASSEPRIERMREDADAYQMYQKCLWKMANQSRRSPKSGKGGSQVSLLSNMLVNAIFADRFTDAKKLWTILDDELLSAEFLSVMRGNSIRVEYERSRNQAFLEHADDLMALRELSGLRGEDGIASEKLYRAYTDLIEIASPGCMRYLRTWQMLSRWEAEFHRGDWVDLTFDEELDLWWKSGNWKFVDKNTATIDNRKGPLNADLTSLAIFRSPVEIEVEIEGGLKTPQFAGIIRGGFEDRPDQWIFFGGRARGKYASMESVDYYGGHYELPPIENLNLMTWGPDWVELLVNGIPLPATDLSALNSQESFVGVGLYRCRIKRGKITFKNLRVRKIPYGPPPESDDLLGRVDYFSKAIKRYPDRAEYHRQRAQALYHLGRYDDAIEDFLIARNNLTNPQNVFVEYFLGCCYLDAGRRLDGEKTLTSLYQNLTNESSQYEVLIGHRAAFHVVRHLTSENQVGQTNIDRAMMLAKSMLDQQESCQSHLAMAMVHLSKGDRERAEVAIAAAEKTCEEPEDRQLIEDCRQRIAQTQ